VRFGDPETQPMMMRLDSDLLELLVATVDGTLDKVRPRWSDDAALSVVMATKGYPGAYKKGGVIRGVAEAEALDRVKVFHAGTALANGSLVSAGGRVLNVTARGRSIQEARTRAYEAVGKIDWADGFCRSDIGARAAEAD
jgi:phosphoribosylamine--glycine ligase